MKTATILTISLLVIGAVAIPAMAESDHRPDERPARDERPDRNESRADKMEEMREKREARHNETVDRLKERCAAFENRTGKDVDCDRLEKAHDKSHQARRAAHALIKAIDALEHRVVVLEKLEVKFMEKLEGENLTANQTAAFEAKLVRIQEAQNKTLEKIEKMEERLERLKEKWDKVRDHVADHRKIVVCHVDEDNETHTIRISAKAWPAHEAHNDTEGACPDFEAEPSDDLQDEEDEASGDEEAAPEEEDGNATAPPS